MDTMSFGYFVSKISIYICKCPKELLYSIYNLILGINISKSIIINNIIYIYMFGYVEYSFGSRCGSDSFWFFGISKKNIFGYLGRIRPDSIS